MPRKPLPGWRTNKRTRENPKWWSVFSLSGTCSLGVTWHLDWEVFVPGAHRSGYANTLESAQLAAEDAAREQVKLMAEDLGMEVRDADEARAIPE
jgi:hypothetical protein